MESVHRQSPCRAGEIKKNATGEKGGVGADPLQPSHQELRGNGDERKYGIEGELRAQGPRLHHAPEEKVGDVIGDLNRRRGMIQGQEPTPGGVRVKAEAPLSAMFGYIGDLRTMTSGRGQFSMEFSHYAPCPKNVSDDVIAKAKAREEAARK